MLVDIFTCVKYDPGIAGDKKINDAVTQADVCVGPDIVTIKLTNADSGVTLLDEDKNGMTVRMDIGSIEFLPISTPRGNFILPRIGSFSRSFSVGEPTLPIASRLISIPFDCSLKVDVTVPLPRISI